MKIRQCELRHQEERIILTLENGDKLNLRHGSRTGGGFAQERRPGFYTGSPQPNHENPAAPVSRSHPNHKGAGNKPAPRRMMALVMPKHKSEKGGDVNHITALLVRECLR